jgi:hypothetical protein
MARTEINWLHFSDFHIGMDAYAQRKLLKQITKFVGEQTKLGDAFDFVFLTGDIANKGKSEEYDEFLEAFLIPLTEALGADWQGKILAVPGNHDVDRTKAAYFSPVEILAESRFFDPTKDGQGRRSQFFPRFLEYTNADCSAAPRRWLEMEAGAYDVTCKLTQATVAIIGLNTAWISKDENDRNRLSPGINLLDDLLERNSSADIKIVLGHHPLSWIQDPHARRISALFGKHNVIYLCGHLHEADTRYEDGARGTFLTLQSGAAFQVRPDDNPKLVNGFQRARLSKESNQLLVQARHWSDIHQEWKVSTDAFVNERKSEIADWWSFDLPVPYLPPQAHGPSPTTPDPHVSPAAVATASVPKGWQLLDDQFIVAHQRPPSREEVLQYFDGRPPDRGTRVAYYAGQIFWIEGPDQARLALKEAPMFIPTYRLFPRYLDSEELEYLLISGLAPS